MKRPANMTLTHRHSEISDRLLANTGVLSPGPHSSTCGYTLIQNHNAFNPASASSSILKRNAGTAAKE